MMKLALLCRLFMVSGEVEHIVCKSPLVDVICSTSGLARIYYVVIYECGWLLGCQASCMCVPSQNVAVRNSLQTQVPCSRVSARKDMNVQICPPARA